MPMDNKYFFPGTLNQFQDIFTRLNIKPVIRQFKNMVRFEIGSVFVDWWRMYRGKTVHIHGTPPAFVEKVQKMLAQEFRRSFDRPWLIPDLIKSLQASQGGKIEKTDTLKNVSFRVRNIPATFTVEDRGRYIKAMAWVLSDRGEDPQFVSAQYEVQTGPTKFGPFMKDFIAKVRAVGEQINAGP